MVLDAASDLRWNQSILLTGCRIRLVGTPERSMTAPELTAALGPHTACVLWFSGYVTEGGLPISEVIGGAGGS